MHLCATHYTIQSIRQFVHGGLKKFKNLFFGNNGELILFCDFFSNC